MSSLESKVATVGATGIQEVPPTASAKSLSVASEIAQSSERRKAIPLRKRFVRRSSATADAPPLASLVARGGRGGMVAIKLYLALIWRCSADPYKTEVSAGQWAILLDLAQPSTHGARRVAAALDALESEGLVVLTRRRGDSSVIELRNESGDGSPYEPPSESYAKPPSGEIAKRTQDDANLYLRVPRELWLEGHIQSMSAPAITMLLVLLCDQQAHERSIWWSTDRFPARFGLTPTTRARGTKELVARRLLTVTKERVFADDESRTFGRQRVRNKYLLINAAYPHHDEDRARPNERATRTFGQTKQPRLETTESRQGR